MSDPWPVALCLPPGDLAGALAEAVAGGFTHVEVVALADRPAGHLDLLADAGVHVAVAGLALGPGDGLAAAKRQVADAALLGATCAWLRAPADPAALPAFAEGWAALAEHAAGRMVRLALAPSAALPDLAAWLGWLEALAHPGVGLRLDDPSAEEVRRAGARLWSLRVEAELPAGLADALRAAGYRGVVSRTTRRPGRTAGRRS